MDPLYSLSHTTTPQNTHTQALNTQTAAGDEEGAPAGEGEAEGDEGRRETDCYGQFSGDPRAETGHLRLERTSPVFGMISEDGNGRLTSSDRFLRAETKEKLQTPLLGFLGDEGSRSQNPSETGTFQADEGTPDSVEEEETNITEKGENLTYDSSSFRAPQLGFGEASPFINGGRRFEPFNLDEFLKLANAVIDKGDEQTITALRDLKTRWKERFRSVPSLRSLVEKRDAAPRVGGLRPAMRCLLPTGTSNGAPETDGNSTNSYLQSPVPEISRLSAGNEPDLLPPSTDMAAPVKGDRRLTSPAMVGIPTSADVASVGEVDGEVDGTVAVDKDGDVTGDASMTSADITKDDITADITAGNITAYITADIMDDIILHKKTKKQISTFDYRAPTGLFVGNIPLLGKLPTTDKSWLSHLGVCILCDEGATESHPHLFFQCRFSRQCLYEIRRRIRFHWPNRDWATDIEWATRKWRGEHIINRAYRTLLAACVYHIWKERNLRRFDHTERTPATLSILIINDVRQRILSVDLASSVSTRALYRLWRIPWVEGETNTINDDKIAHAFHNSTRKTLSYVAPTVQKGEVIVRPTLDIIRNGSKRWMATAVGYFLGKRPYFHHLKEFAKSIWPDLKEVTGTNNGFFFFQFKSVVAMEDVIKGGPWLYQGQPIILQKWKPGMVLRKLQHTEVPLWTEEGLSTVASGVGKPLYPDAITRACTRLDFARVCVILDVTSNLPKHIIIMTPDEDGGESPCKVDVEYEWIPPKCKSCMTLGHSAKECVINKPKPVKPPIAVYITKVGTPYETAMSERSRNHPREDGDTTYIPSRPTRLPDRKINRPPQAPVVEKKREGREPPRDATGPSREEKGKAVVIYNTFDALHILDDTDESIRAIWNVRGLNKRDHQLAVRDIVAEYRLQFLSLLETRVRFNNAAQIQSFLLPHWKWYMDYGSSGNRVWIAWDDNFIDVNVVQCGMQYIHYLVNIRAIHESVAVTVAYGATEVIDRRELWNALESLAIQCTDIPWLIGGDFNAVRDLSEVCGTSGDIRIAIEDFNAAIQNTRLLPLPMQGEWYTWHNHSATPWNLCKRLDRMLINDRWMARFPNTFYSVLTPHTSDHSPMVLNGDQQQQYGGMFRFDNYLTRSSEFIPSVQNIWQHNIIGTPMYAVTCKLKALKPIFREQRRNKGDLSHNVQMAKGFLEAAQLLVSSRRRDELYIQLEHCCRLVLAKATKLKQIMLNQRAKMQWMKGGDQCSRVFFRKIAQRRSSRRIFQINDEQGSTHTDPEEVINEFITYYQNLLGGDRRRARIDIRFLRPWARHIWSNEESTALLLPFTPANVKQAVFDIAKDKAPGPDGYSSGFFKAAWPIVGQEVSSAVLDFFNTGRLLKQINTTLLALIPKVHSPMTVSDFWPIASCNVLYKIITKLIVQRSSVIMDKLISPCQAAFVPGRSIGDNIMLAQELFTGYNQTRLPPRCALKVDIRKAYDTMDWDFLMEVLEMFGFPSTFVKWIEECVTTPSFSVGLNGKPMDSFEAPEDLGRLIDQEELFSYHWKCEAARIFQLGFADDVILFSRADMESLRIFKAGLDRFAEWSSLRLNVQKSHLIISRSAQTLREEMLALLGFQEGVLPMRYLGLPLISSRLTIAYCHPLLQKIDKRIAGWEGTTISYAGRVQIIKSVLISLSLCWASAFILPKKVINEIEKRLRAFLWKGTTNSGYAKVAWKDICRPKEEGGLGFKDISTLNRALMTKKLCDVIRCDKTSIWVEWLYKGRLQHTSVWTITDHGGSWGWRKILRLRMFLRTMVDYRIGDGRNFFLWQDPWHHLGPLCDTFPRGPRLLGLDESCKLSTVIHEGVWQWPLITDIECLEITHVLPTIFGGEDRIIWRFENGRPTTQAIYELCDPPGPKVGWASLLSGSLKIPRHIFILWLAIQDKLATTNKPWLAHLGPCVLCNEGLTETHAHLFFQCRFSRRCLTEIRRTVRFLWPNREWKDDITWASQRWRGKHIINMSYRALLAACVYHIWKERNLRRFDNTERTPTTIALLIIEDIRQ
ncbi:UNVERIFIED_CONTAM: hypothetical protein Sindi_2651700 [Sesamum indicum]